MPRKSVASQQVVSIVNVPRIKAPPHLPDSQRIALQGLIDSKPGDYFQACDLPLLVQLVRHLEAADRWATETQALESGDLDGLKWLSTQAERESKAIVLLMRTLRLSPQARYRPDATSKHRAAFAGPRPWEVEG